MEGVAAAGGILPVRSSGVRCGCGAPPALLRHLLRQQASAPTPPFYRHTHACTHARTHAELVQADDQQSQPPTVQLCEPGAFLEHDVLLLVVVR